jgi:hypothetical protein
MKNLSEFVGRMFHAELPQERAFSSLILGLAFAYMVLSIGNSSAACSEPHQADVNPVMISTPACR